MQLLILLVLIAAVLALCGAVSAATAIVGGILLFLKFIVWVIAGMFAGALVIGAIQWVCK